MRDLLLLMRDWRALLAVGGSVAAAVFAAVFGNFPAWVLLAILLMTPFSLLVNVLIQRRIVRGMGARGTVDDLRVTQKRVFVLDMPFDEAFDSCAHSIEALRRGRLGRCDRVRGLVNGRTAWSWNSFGDKISFRLSSLDDQRTRVELTSHPLYHSTLVDYGSNYDNAERLTANLGVQPDQYLLRAARAGDADEELLRAATGGPAESDVHNLLRPDRPDEPHSYQQADDRVQPQNVLRR